MKYPFIVDFTIVPSFVNFIAANNAIIDALKGSFVENPTIASIIAAINELASLNKFQATFPHSILLIKSAIPCPTDTQSVFSKAVVNVVSIPLIVVLIDFPNACQPVRPVSLSTSSIPLKNPLIPSAILVPKFVQVSFLDTKV